jgi:phospholipase/carboxylesterase
MPARTKRRTAEHPPEGFRSVALPGFPTRPVRVYLPTDYQPKYEYPLVVLFHDAGESEDQAVRLVPRLSRRNYVALCLRAPVNLGPRPDGRPAFGWGAGADRGARAALRHTTTEYSIHRDRVFLFGVGDGAAAALRFGLDIGDRARGLVMIGGGAPAGRVPPTALNVLLASGRANPSAARLRAAGATVRVARYSGAPAARADVLRDANRWIMDQIAKSARD